MARPQLWRWSWILSASIVALSLLLSGSASAQTTTGGGNCPNIRLNVNPTVPRYRQGGDTPANAYPYRPQNLDPTAINYQDCIDDINLEFTLLIGGLPCTDTIWVWAGTTDCTQTSARQRNSGSTQCWPVAQIGAFTMAATSTANILARDIVAHLSDSSTSSTNYTIAPASACQSQDAPGSVGLTIYFMAMEPDGETVDGSTSYALDGDLVGPYPPTDVVAGIGDGVIIVSWTPAVDSTIQGFNVYCQPRSHGADASGTLPEASLVCATSTSTTTTTTTTDAAADATTTTTTDGGCHYVNVLDSGGVAGASACTSPGNVLKNVWSSSLGASTSEGGVVVTTDASSPEASVASTTAVGISNIPGQFLCGQVGGNTTSSLNVTNLSFDGSPGIQDGTEYAVTVAAYDGTGNVGIIGNLSCVTPSPIITFWDAYIKDCTATNTCVGGGFCALQGPGMPVSSSLFGIGAGAVGVGLLRRRRRRGR
jgi:hypothetical protein